MAAVTTLCVSRGFGGGLSYTGGYLPSEADSVIVDLRGLDRIVEINVADMYGVVAVGWA